LAGRQVKFLLQQRGTDAVLAARSLSDERVPLFNKSSPLAHLRRRHVHQVQLLERRQASQLEGVVLVGLALDVLPFPGVLCRVGHLDLDAHLTDEIMDPAGQRADLDDDPLGMNLLEQLSQVAPLGGNLAECHLAGDGVEVAERGLALG